MSNESDLHLEFVAINSIYTDCMIQKAQTIYIISIPGTHISVRLSFPSSYPEKAPEILDIEGTNDPKTKSTIENALKDGFTPGMVCIYEFIENARESLGLYGDVLIAGQDDDPEPVAEIGKKDYQSDNSNVTKGWFESDPIIDRKSVFIARAIGVNSEQEAQAKIDLLKQDKKIAKATHNVTCWRIKRDDGIIFQDCDDDGETAAGGRLSHLVTLTDSWNVVVVVSRWYGGILLGPDR